MWHSLICETREVMCRSINNAMCSLFSLKETREDYSMQTFYSLLYVISLNSNVNNSNKGEANLKSKKENMCTSLVGYHGLFWLCYFVEENKVFSIGVLCPHLHKTY